MARLCYEFGFSFAVCLGGALLVCCCVGGVDTWLGLTQRTQLQLFTVRASWDFRAVKSCLSTSLDSNSELKLESEDGITSTTHRLDYENRNSDDHVIDRRLKTN